MYVYGWTRSSKYLPKYFILKIGNYFLAIWGQIYQNSVTNLVTKFDIIWNKFLFIWSQLSRDSATNLVTKFDVIWKQIPIWTQLSQDLVTKLVTNFTPFQDLVFDKNLDGCNHPGSVRSRWSFPFNYIACSLIRFGSVMILHIFLTKSFSFLVFKFHLQY